MRKKIGNILHWSINGLLIGGLLAFSIMFFKQGDTFHGVLDLLYMLIIVANLFYHQQYEKMKRDHQTAMEASIELIKQNAKLTRKLTEMQDPFRNNPMIQINGQHVRMEILRSTMKREKSFLTGFDEMERNRRLHYMETVAKQELMESIRDTELVEIHHDFEDVHQDTVTAEIIVGVKGDKPIDEIINS